MFNGALLGLTSIGLSTDAFAASVARGSVSRHRGFRHAAGNGLVFGSVEGGMCLLGWCLASSITLISAIDHWIALVLLCFIGSRMIHEARLPRSDESAPLSSHRLRWTLLAAIATSVDSAVVGVALNLAGFTAWSALIIGLTSMAMSTIGFFLGPMASQALGRHAEIAGGVILIAIGVGLWTNHVFY
jgi:putative Mn2+ efflux pump MntP